MENKYSDWRKCPCAFSNDVSDREEKYPEEPENNGSVVYVKENKK